MVSRVFSAFLMEQLGWPGAGVSCAFASPFSTSFPRRLAAPRDLITLGVLAAAGLPCSLPHGRAVLVREPAIASGTSGTGEGAVGAEGDGWQAGPQGEGKGGSSRERSCCLQCSQREHQRNPVGRNCFQGETLQVVSRKTHTLGCSPAEKNMSKFGLRPLTLR